MNSKELEAYKIAIEALLDYSINKTIESFQNLASKTKNQLYIKTKKAFKKYLETAIKKYNEIKTIFNPAEPILLDSFYVDLDLSIGKKLLEGNINSVINYGKPLIITGSAGCGKSTLLKYLFLKTISFKTKLPFFIELKNIKDSEKPFIDNVLCLLNEMNLGLSLEEYLILLEKGEYILFFDGLDEVPPAFYKYVEEEGILSLNDKYYKSLFIVTSRPSEIYKSWQNFAEASINPLTKEKAIMLLDKINYEAEIKERFITDVKSSLFDKHESFLSNPLLLSIMLITYGQYADIPDKLTLFYQQAFEALFNKHDATKQGFKRTRYTTIPIDEFQKIISALSIQSYIEHKINFSKNEIINYLQISKDIVDVQNFDEELVLDDLLQSLCIIVRDGLLYTFTHRSFQEYFSAIFISKCEKSNRNKIITNIKNKYAIDNIFYLLFEIDKTIIEDDFLICKIEELNAIFNTNNNPELSFHREIFSEIYIEKDGGWRLKIKNNDYFDLFHYFGRTYGKYYASELKKFREITKKAINKWIEYQAEEKTEKELYVKIEKIIANQKYYPLFLELIKPDLFLIKKIFELPEKIKTERKNKNNILGILLTK